MVSDQNSEALRSVSDIDWASWLPDDVATLLFILNEGQVLLIRKKRGLGAGKINGPGGRLEPGETPERAAIREVEEEVGVSPLRPEPRGVLSFQFTEGYKLRAHLFVAHEYRGTLRETDEAVPFWFSLDRLPFHEMWEDDALWLPHVLSGRSVEGRFVFQGDKMLSHELDVVESSAARDGGNEPSARPTLAHDASRPRTVRVRDPVGERGTGPSGEITLKFELAQRTATRRLAARLGRLLRGGDLIVLSGPLGSGKTFFARALCSVLGVGRAQVTSPTFALVHEFQGTIPIAHADLYRLGTEVQLSDLGLDELRDDGSLLLVEWGEPYAQALGGDALIVSLSPEPRHATLSAQGHRSSELLQALEND